MAITQEALKTMMEQRNDTHALLAPLSSTVDAGVDQIPPTIPHDNTNSEHPAGSPVASMLDLFSPHYSRWQRVRLRYSDASPGTVVTALPLPMNTTYPLLEEVYLDKGNLAVLIDKVTLPALKDLSLSELHGTSPNPPIQLGRWPQSQFLAFLLRSGCTIKQFMIQEQLTYTPSVISSENVLCHGDDQLADDTPSETICPNLTTIRLWGCISAQDGKVADMVESRWLSRTEGCPIVQLRTAAIGFFADTCHTEDWTRLWRIQEFLFMDLVECDGIYVSVLYT
ncbi:uncharacterized protein LACBIDRAFT_335535 [Laccaria bicolor S238N-H82]|uniref:Predicted protein n=1 Tax=Laccaria bicolor (strain S238N-H82 / ATCC MYA-4686) TaxID=486041 RepID=B0E2L0_LACBS|nr:uncharacterized protein LACBIDRAFT_335535 [Laccaria bicolor S238N-H82]EDQ98922.1 predicted protein [Laccaria bicolor S238N-H82]|eukprot:XP_001890433.1 predicted protein [Laccaria bicolor S238N-H82]